jgi:carbon-monoxide dehydrogenase small subunit
MKLELVNIQVTLNGQAQEYQIPAGITAVEFLRDHLMLKGTKEGCGIGECGSCTIQVDGKAVNACLMLAAQLDGREIWTVEGLAEGEKLHPIQEAFLDHHAVQCGFCTPGLLMSTKALLEADRHPDRETIVRAVAGNLCRCTGYQQIFAAIEDVASQRAKGS